MIDHKKVEKTAQPYRNELFLISLILELGL